MEADVWSNPSCRQREQLPMCQGKSEILKSEIEDTGDGRNAERNEKVPLLRNGIS